MAVLGHAVLFGTSRDDKEDTASERTPMQWHGRFGNDISVTFKDAS